MTGLDTNVLVRYFLQDDPAQDKLAVAFLTDGCTSESPAFINHIVLCELVWVLKRRYSLERPGIAELIAEVLRTRQWRVQSPRTVWLALQDYEDGKADFADCLVARLNLDEGCTETVTFDAKASKCPGMRLLV